MKQRCSVLNLKRREGKCSNNGEKTSGSKPCHESCGLRSSKDSTNQIIFLEGYV